MEDPRGKKSVEENRTENNRRVCFYVLYVVTIFIPVVVVYSVIAWMSQFTHLHDNAQRSVILSRRTAQPRHDGVSTDRHRRSASGEPVKSVRSDLHGEVADSICAEKIRQNSQHYSALPHPPGSLRNEKLAREMAEQWKTFGFDKTELFKYKVLLSYPKRPARITLRRDNKIIERLRVVNEPAFGKSEHNGKPVYPFNAFSAPGKVTGSVAFVNYGTSEDYDLLQTLGVKLEGKIFLIRYGTPHPRSKLIGDAERQGAIGVVFYSDPADYTDPGEEYPKGWMLNKYGVQRGSIYEMYGEALSQVKLTYDQNFKDQNSKTNSKTAYYVKDAEKKPVL